MNDRVIDVATAGGEPDVQAVQELHRVHGRIRKELAKVIVGQDEVLDQLLIALFAGGHCMLEGVPGLAKTLAVRTLSEIIHASFSRIQFTPDLLPADLIGTMVFDQKTQEFHVKKGPLFAQIILADEINRAPAKVQAALLEAMQEHQVTIGGTTFPLDEPFMVLATQNPIEQEGTFPLPEAQLDRFMMRISLGYPSRGDEMKILDAQQLVHPIEAIGEVISRADLMAMQQRVKKTYVDLLVLEYIVDVVTATREHQEVYLGASPRGSQALHKATQARAALLGRDYAIPDDVKALAPATLAHRLIVSPAARIRNVDPRHVIDEIYCHPAIAR